MLRELLHKAQAMLTNHGVAIDDGTGHRACEGGVLGLPARLAELGQVRQLHIREAGGGLTTVLMFSSADNLRVYLSPESGRPERQLLHLIGRVSSGVMDACGVGRELRAQTPVVLGPLHRIVYAVKSWDGEPTYEHPFGYEFGSDGSEVPVLVYWAAERRLALLGGVYWVLRDGIVN